ncbi:putative scp gapr-1 like scp-like extracellular protein [Operophtera brumata]|uniref:Putative scp gapr-1 like scp-like extracellular protein n=1 Tax=Operophtera brumata TaxID=104452 RepID=A0A0L7LCH6_OPEBR|nr:putative scp gapr-1 like scp-like extracellular protein [Operophtera brumata]
MTYDFDLQEMAEAWLQQCLPGYAPCSSLDSAKPQYECFILPAIGCIHAWFLSAGKELSGIDVECGHTSPSTYNTVQLLWAETYRIGCAFGDQPNGDVRVLCNFSPSVPYYIKADYYCGLIALIDSNLSYPFRDVDDITDLDFLDSHGVHINKVNNEEENISYDKIDTDMAKMPRTSRLDSLSNIYKTGWVREKLHDFSNGTKGLIARLVTKYTFLEHDDSRCDTDKPMYVIGRPGSLCVQRGTRFDALCNDFGDPTPGYRLVAILAPIALFSLILYDLFSGVGKSAGH